MADRLPMEHFYQFGYLASDIDAAAQALRERFGITRTRYKRPSDWMETLHAWTGDTMVEVIVCGQGAPALYTDFALPPPGDLRLHHLGRRIMDDAVWQAMERVVAARGIGTDMMGAVMNGQLRYAYVDTRAMLGIYTEYVMLRGDALKIYDDVPQNG
ncbi:hypothetical protein Q4610_07050 [Sphingobium sp. HBC34]|uniref:VOC domain-containing protein n=1 Tax=Sphingobium cyanobacteriorum TaxID=3063954 RepID=A0ABT8ZKR6_9SPHN|nr:hypothetical protein [Sphingobium sp. HBC34]MDO7834801.1 hypothetical protein [Sphingobium sp. HBC34]